MSRNERIKELEEALRSILRLAELQNCERLEHMSPGGACLSCRIEMAARAALYPAKSKLARREREASKCS